MKHILLVVLVLLLSGCSSGQRMKALDGMPEGSPVEKIHMTGQNCIWSPGIIAVQGGTHVVLEMESVDIAYQCDVPVYGLHFKVPAGQRVTAEFYAPAPDKLEIGCNIHRNVHYQWGGVSAELKIS